MAVGHVSTTNGTGSSSAGVTATATITADVGDTLLLCAGCDNRTTAALALDAVTDSAGNTWTRLTSQQSTATNASHVAHAIYGCTVTNALTAGTVTLTAHASAAVKDFTLYRFTGLSLTIRGTAGSVSTGALPQLVTSAPLDGDLVLVCTVLEGPTSDTWTEDTDTTFGSWSATATDGTTGGTAAANVAIRSQFKIVNATGSQNYNPTAGTSRDWARSLVVLAPTPPPPAAPAPPPYVAQYPIVVSTAVGRVTASVIDCYAYAPDAFDVRLPPLVYMAGAGSTGDELAGGVMYGLQPLVHALVDAGFLIVSPTTILTYGNATGQAGVSNALSWARTNFGCSSLPAPIIGASEGACDAMTFAYLNPTLVACVVGLIPVIDLAEMVEQNVFGLGQAVLDAWADAALPLPTDADPAAHQTELAQIPMQHWYSTNDEVSANITAFRNGTGCDVRAVGELGHSNEAIAAAWPTEIVRFIRKRVRVPL